MIDVIRSNWQMILAVILVLGAAGLVLYRFSKKDNAEQVKQLKEWLLYAVVNAEKEFGSGTGVIKLRYVYNLFLTKFPVLAMVLSFEAFSKYVDEALKKMETLLTENTSVANYIAGENQEEEA